MKHHTDQRTLKWLRAITFATVLGTTTSSHAESDLVKQGIYAEETEGDLKKAISFYQKEVDAHTGEQGSSEAWASALLRLAKCQLKLGNKELARSAANQIVAELKGKEALLREARVFIASLEPSKGHKVTLVDIDDQTQATLLDFETGQLKRMDHFHVEDRGNLRQMEELGVDLIAEFIRNKAKGLGIMGRLGQVESRYWNEVPDYAEIDRVLAALAPEQAPIAREGSFEFHEVAKDAVFPVTYVFRSTSHATGVLQVLAVDEAKQEMTIQYQLVSRVLEGEVLRDFVIGRWSIPGKEDGMHFTADGRWYEDEGIPEVTDDHGTYRVNGKVIELTVPNRPKIQVTVRLEGAQTIFELMVGDRGKEITAVKTPYALTPEQKMTQAKIKVPAMLNLVQSMEQGVHAKEQIATRGTIDTFLREFRSFKTLFQNTDLDGMVLPMIQQVEQLREAVTIENWDKARQVLKGISTAGPMMEKMLEQQIRK